MRFKAELTNSKVLVDLLTSLSHVGKYLLFQLNASRITACIDRTVSADTDTEIIQANEQCFVELRIDALFQQYRIESKNADHSISMLFNIQNAIQALRSVDTASHTTIKLSKHSGYAWLTLIAVDSQSYQSQLQNRGDSTGSSVTHHIPIQVMTQDDYMSRATEPRLSAPIIKLYMPPLRKLLLLLDQMRALGHAAVKITLKANGMCYIMCVLHLSHITLTPALSATIQR